MERLRRDVSHGAGRFEERSILMNTSYVSSQLERILDVSSAVRAKWRLNNSNGPFFRGPLDGLPAFPTGLVEYSNGSEIFASRSG